MSSVLTSKTSRFLSLSLSLSFFLFLCLSLSLSGSLALWSSGFLALTLALSLSLLLPLYPSRVLFSFFLSFSLSDPGGVERRDNQEQIVFVTLNPGNEKLKSLCVSRRPRYDQEMHVCLWARWTVSPQGNIISRDIGDW